MSSTLDYFASGSYLYFITCSMYIKFLCFMMVMSYFILWLTFIVYMILVNFLNDCLSHVFTSHCVALLKFISYLLNYFFHNQFHTSHILHINILRDNKINVNVIIDFIYHILNLHIFMLFLLIELLLEKACW